MVTEWAQAWARLCICERGGMYNAQARGRAARTSWVYAVYNYERLECLRRAEEHD